MHIFYQYSKNTEKEPQVFATIYSPCLHLLDFGVLFTDSVKQLRL